MLTDKRIIECEDHARRTLKVELAFNDDVGTEKTAILTDTADALAELLRWRERSNQQESEKPCRG